MSVIDKQRIAEREGEEIWELTIPGRVSVSITNHLNQPATRSVKGAGSRLRISTHDRMIAQEQVRLPENDPFQNGMLVRVDTRAAEDPGSEHSIDDEELAILFSLDQGEFEAQVPLQTQVNCRRLLAMAEGRGATVGQFDFLKRYVAETWPIGGDTPTYREMKARPQGFAE